jgi:hypothetical protein
VTGIPATLSFLPTVSPEQIKGIPSTKEYFVEFKRFSAKKIKRKKKEGFLEKGFCQQKHPDFCFKTLKCP